MSTVNTVYSNRSEILSRLDDDNNAHLASEALFRAHRTKTFEARAAENTQRVTRERGHRGVREQSSSAGVPCLPAMSAQAAKY